MRLLRRLTERKLREEILHRMRTDPNWDRLPGEKPTPVNATYDRPGAYPPRPVSHPTPPELSETPRPRKDPDKVEKFAREAQLRQAMKVQDVNGDGLDDARYPPTTYEVRNGLGEIVYRHTQRPTVWAPYNEGWGS